ncbi:hypothetical protein [Streptomyces buecherae]|uniref:Uncharacterized protein n=1 Tax=Streptomyces buecherae TaxID=2763006 RepID=A0A7G8KGT9_9ACTN|nr:hypothetical protein [Streptomyces buecherae]MBC3984749.1 hypothetical protein [Streptomyces buecherae]MBC3988786.1 hypothetical protein [Streptomyces buecherae]QKW50132.1 hypothetical protein HUT08_11940 [Streptomyces buecherae]QNJ42272.1 hypothetical protein H7H31_22860 [Streptomyces buecherae]
MNTKKVLAGSMLSLAAAGFAVTPATAAEAEDTGRFEQNIQIIDDLCPTVQDIDVLVIEVLDEARTNQCNTIHDKAAQIDNSDAPGLPIGLLGSAVN